MVRRFILSRENEKIMKIKVTVVFNLKTEEVYGILESSESSAEHITFYNAIKLHHPEAIIVTYYK
jgi:hypothetical protein